MSASLPSVHLKPGHVQPLWAGHPWVYAQAIARVEGSKPAAGDVVRVVDPQGKFLGRGFWSPRPSIPVRLMVRDESTSLDTSAWLVERIEAASRRRRMLGLPSEGDRSTTGFRLLHAEGDDVPGLVVDHYGCNAQGKGGTLVVQVQSAGLRKRAKLVLEALQQVVEPLAIVDRTTESTSKVEGFALDTSFRAGEAPSAFSFAERGLHYALPGDVGQKTGFYFDQRDLRARVEGLSRGRRVLDAFCYVGPIAMSAARGGATEVLAMDDSLRAVEVGAACAKQNQLTIRFERGDVRREFPRLQKEGRQFDLLVLDPPKLAPKRSDRHSALTYHARLLEESLPLLARGGLLVLCSCSSAIGSADLMRTLAIGARRADREATVVERLGQGPDHPVPAVFPEGIYLSTLIAEVR